MRRVAGALLIFCITASQALGVNPSVDALIGRLLARQASLSTGTLRFTHFRFIAEDDVCQAIERLADDNSKSLQDIEVAIVQRGADGKLSPEWQYTATIAYRGDVWHLSRALVPDFTVRLREAREKSAKEQGVELVSKGQLEEIAYNGEYITLLEDGERLIRRAFQPREEYQMLSCIDPVFFSWTEMRKGKPAPGQTSSATFGSEFATLSEAWQDGVKATWWFSVARDYAPVKVERVSSKGVMAERRTFRVARMDAKVPVVQVAILRRRQSDGQFKVDCFLVSEWSSEVNESDLTIEPPSKSYVLVDERPGRRFTRVENVDPM